MKEFLIGVDSDGTAFDSMNAKHRGAFIPAMIEVWGLQQYAEIVKEICERINLYSKTRGIDRFRGLVLTFEEIEKQGINIADYSSLKEYIDSVQILSNATLESYIKEKTDLFLKNVLKWSKRSDILFSKQVENLPPFTGVKEALEYASCKADIAVVSSASKDGLLKDWKNGDIEKYTYKIMGQENGTKKQQLETAAMDYAPECVLMIGDALGDYAAAESVGALFYPIVPGKEEVSWKIFKEEACDKFFTKSFSKDYQQKLLEEFMAVLT